ncbi:unnamed protein product [Laminaria digitata]
MAAGSDGRMVLVGNTNGSWEGGAANLGGGDFLAVMLNTTTLAPLVTPTLSPTAALSPAQGGSPSTVHPVASPPSNESDSSGTTPIIVAGVAFAVAGVALIAFGFWYYKRRQTARKLGTGPLVSPANGEHNVRHSREYDDRQQGVGSHNTPAVVVNRGNNRRPQYQHHHPAKSATDYGEGMVPTSRTTASARPVLVPSSTKQTATRAGEVGGVAVALTGGVVTEEERLAQQKQQQFFLTPTNSTADVSAAERAEFAGIRMEDAAIFADEPTLASVEREVPFTAGRRGVPDDVGIGQAVMVAAQELAQSCQIPGVSEAATLVSILVNLVSDSRDHNSGGDARLRQCRSIVMLLHRAAKVSGNGEHTTGKVARVLIEDVHDAIFDLVELVKTYQSKNKLSKVLMSTLFKRRQEELDAVVDRAIVRLQLGLHVQVGQDVSAVKKGMDLYKVSLSVRHGCDLISPCSFFLWQGSIAEATLESLAEARSMRRQRKLNQVEIPEEQVTITDEVLGKGGFGKVYLADYNGRNAAAKVRTENHYSGPLAGRANKQRGGNGQRRAFLRELDAMIRLRSPHTVNVYGAVTSLPDRMVLVMELLAGGDLRTLLKNSNKQPPLPEERSRRIIRDICAGMAFLHSKDCVHGDLKSANVLLDGAGRAKIGDFGTSRWSQHTNSTGLATYTTNSSQSTQMSLAWSAPEVLESGGSTYASDVYSFGIVVWEVISGDLPWANKTRPRDILSAVLMGVRPSFRDDAPADVVEIAKACWDGEPKARTTFGAVLEGLKSRGWSE